MFHPIIKDSKLQSKHNIRKMWENMLKVNKERKLQHQPETRFSIASWKAGAVCIRLVSQLFFLIYYTPISFA